MDRHGHAMLAAAVMAVALAGALMIVPAASEESDGETVSIEIGESVTAVVNTSTGKITIAGTGDTYDYGASQGSPFSSYIDDITSVEIRSGVTSIGANLFYNILYLESVTIADTVTSIGNGAFEGCRALTSITIPASVTSIGNSAFRTCQALTSITIPASVTSIGDYAFQGCLKLTGIVFEGAHPTIGDSAFDLYVTTTCAVTLMEEWTSLDLDSYSNSGVTWTYTLSGFAFTSTSTSNTVSYGQRFTYTPETTESTATIAIQSDGTGCLSVSSSGVVSGTLTCNPGTYSVVIAATYGTQTITQTVTITVPIYITEPAQASVYTGVTWTYTPTTNPTGATITLVSVTYSGSSTSSHTVTSTGSALTGVFNNPGTYTVNYTASKTGYTSTNDSVVVVVTDPPVTVPDLVFSSMAASPGSGNTWYFVASVTGYSTITWDYGDGSDTESGALSVVHTYEAAGYYTVTCTVVGLDGTTAKKTADVLATDTSYHEDAWIDVLYSYMFEISDGTTAVLVTDADWLSVSTVVTDDGTYAWVQGTPKDTTLAGTSVAVAVSYGDGTEEWTIYIHARESTTPTSAVVTSADGLEVVLTYTGSASMLFIDWGDGGGSVRQSSATGAHSHTYASAGTYTISVTAINNVGESTSTATVTVAEKAVDPVDPDQEDSEDPEDPQPVDPSGGGSIDDPIVYTLTVGGTYDIELPAGSYTSAFATADVTIPGMTFVDGDDSTDTLSVGASWTADAPRLTGSPTEAGSWMIVVTTADGDVWYKIVVEEAASGTDWTIVAAVAIVAMILIIIAVVIL